MLSALRGAPLTIYGDGCQVRDALYVADAVDAWLAVLDNIATTGGRIFNLGGGPSNAISLLELIELIAQGSGAKVDFSFADWRPGDQPWYVTDVSALTAATGWQPKTPLAAGLRGLQGWLTSRFSRRQDQGALA
jgi:CDP-paratose 2-epimerase